MTWAAEISWINQQVQIGAETTPGTAVAAGKRLECFDWIFGINPTLSDYTPTGHKYVGVREEDAEQTDLTIGGNLDFNGLVYLLSGAMGIVTPTAHGSSATAKDWAFTPPVLGSVQPQTYSVQQGDAIRARKVAYATLNQFGYKGTRITQQTVNSTGFCQPLSDGITLTASPTAIALAPVVSKFFNFYLDSTSGALGTTQLLRVFGVDYSFGNIAGPFFAYNRATTGFTAHVDLMPKSTVKLLMEADSNGMAPLSYMQQGTTYYLRVEAQGNQIASDGPGAVNNLFRHDMAIKFGKPTPFKDEQGIFALEWECVIVEDSAWNSGQAQTALVTNLLTAL